MFGREAGRRLGVHVGDLEDAEEEDERKEVEEQLHKPQTGALVGARAGLAAESIVSDLGESEEFPEDDAVRGDGVRCARRIATVALWETPVTTAGVFR